MNDLSILVRNINNLTDARYFAAWQPEFLALSATDDIDQIKYVLDALTPWIEGPKWAVELPKMIKPSFIRGLKDLLGVHAIIGNVGQLMDFDFSPLTKIVRLEDRADIHQTTLADSPHILSPDQAMAMVKNDKSGAIFVEIERVEDWHKCHLIHDKIQGISLSGGEEEKVGWKSFDQVDDLLELISQSMGEGRF